MDHARIYSVISPSAPNEEESKNYTYCVNARQQQQQEEKESDLSCVTLSHTRIFYGAG